MYIKNERVFYGQKIEIGNRDVEMGVSVTRPGIQFGI
jgi:hypothetical protein